MDLPEERQQYEDYLLVERAIAYIESHYKEQPDLDEIAQNMHMSKYHFQRVFTRWAGVSPHKFLQYLAISHAKQLLGQSKSLLEVSDQVGLSSSSRLHDLFVSYEAITPGEYKQWGEGLEISYGFHYTCFGRCFIALTHRGICTLSFPDAQPDEEVVSALTLKWSRSVIRQNQELTQRVIKTIFASKSPDAKEEIKLLLKGTNFQIKVWEALLDMDFGQLVSYKDIASAVGVPRGVRAVGSAVANNAIAYLIPCHRVIRESGVLHQYRWGTARKKALIGWESARL